MMFNFGILSVELSKYGESCFVRLENGRLGWVLKDGSPAGFDIPPMSREQMERCGCKECVEKLSR